MTCRHVTIGVKAQRTADRPGRTGAAAPSVRPRRAQTKSKNRIGLDSYSLYFTLKKAVLLYSMNLSVGFEQSSWMLLVLRLGLVQ